MNDKLRIIVFTAGEMTPVDRVFYENVAADPLFELLAIVVDDYRPRPRPLLTRIARAIRDDGPRWITFKLASKLRASVRRVAMAMADRIHGPAVVETSTLPLHHVSDIHSDESLALIRSFKPDVGVIVGGRILRDSVISIPRLGSLNIHKLKLPAHRGGGPVGYWEIAGGESSIGVSIHYATSDVDAGAVLAQAEIPIEECDTLESLRIKADLRGAQLYHDALHRMARGEREGMPQDLARGVTHRAPSEYKIYKLHRRLEREAAAKRGVRSGIRSRLARLRVLVEYLAMLPSLQRLRRVLTSEQRAPVTIFFYHLVADRALNHMCLTLPAFVRQMEFLRRYYPILALDEAVALLRSGRNDRVAASITFDDGYRDNVWAVEYLRHMRIPATFFVSAGHVLDGSRFEHDRRRGFTDAAPMSPLEVRDLARRGFAVESHAVHHEDFGTLTPVEADRILRESAEQIAAICGVRPRSFAFPKGQRGTNITPATLKLALEHYESVFSAYGGYSFPEAGRRHFLRISNPNDLFELNLAMSGYTGFRACLDGNAWGLKTAALNPAVREARIALIAASPAIVGGHSVQAAALTSDLRRSGHTVDWIPIDVRFPLGLRWLRRIPYARTILNELLYLPSLMRILRADIVHVFAASYWSFLLGPAPAMLIAKLLGKRLVLHYHSGEAGDHLTRWRRVLSRLLPVADEIVVPSAWLQKIFESHGYATRVIQNVVDTAQFHYRERPHPKPHLLSVRNLENYYQVENTVAAFAQLKEQFPDATLTIAGYGSRERDIRQLADRLRLTGIRFLGRVEPVALADVYDEADIFVNSSVVDNQPVSILEAFASGLPVVSTPAGDIPSMLRGGEAGCLVRANDPSAMAGAVARLLVEPEASLQITRRAREEVVRYAPQRVVDQWNSLYSDLLHA
ncbi:MAG TPA: glycosyltransferase [Thermoanaerobaculia bacterium]|nr:glycosyltransferase [Thermoanaerobaculia bacterium]